MSVRLTASERGVTPLHNTKIPLTFVGVLGLVVVALFTPSFVPVLPIAVLNLLAFVVLAPRLAPLALSPAVYFAAYLSAVGLLGNVFSNPLTGSGGTGGVDVLVTDDLLRGTANALLIASSLVLVSAAVTRGPNKSGNASRSAALDLGDLTRLSALILVLGVIELALLVYFLGVNALISRPDRLVGRGSSIEAAIQMAAIGAVAGVAIVLFSGRPAQRWLAFILLVGFVGYFISLGTRRLALVPLLILLGSVFAKRGKISVLALIPTVLVSVVLLALPLYFRGLSMHGLVPHLGGLSAFVLDKSVLAASTNNVLAGFKITAMTGFSAPKIDASVLWISISPITGGSVGWYEVAPTLRLNKFTPFSGIGELINYGPIVFICAFTMLGGILGIMQRVNDRILATPGAKITAIGALGLVFIFTIQSTQYNLRSDIRYLYFAIAVQIVGLLLMRSSTLKRVNGVVRGSQ